MPPKTMRYKLALTHFYCTTAYLWHVNRSTIFAVLCCGICQFFKARFYRIGAGGRSHRPRCKGTDSSVPAAVSHETTDLLLTFHLQLTQHSPPHTTTTTTTFPSASHSAPYSSFFWWKSASLACELHYICRLVQLDTNS